MRLFALILVVASGACSLADSQAARGIAPQARWDHRPESSEWTKATLRSLEAEGAVLVSSVPSDIGGFCPGYAEAGTADRKAFWVGLLSAVAELESDWNPRASGGGGAYRGLMQISDATAAANGCATGPALYDGGENLACAVRIVSAHVERDGALIGGGGKGWLGLARDWMPLRKPAVRDDIASWTASQPYCG
jgi:hypothetical protein